MIAEMERASLPERDNIEAKGKLRSPARKAAPPTQAALMKEISELQKKLKGTTHDANMTQLSVQKLAEQSSEDAVSLEDSERKVLELRQNSQRLEESVAAQEQQELLLLHQVKAHNRLTRKLTAAAEGGYQPIGREEEIEERLNESQDTSQRLVHVVEALSGEFAGYAPRLSSLMQSISLS